MIRPMNDEESRTVVDIWLKASLHGHAFIDEAFWRSKQSDMLDIYLPNAENWVFEEDGAVVGFYSLAGETLAALFVLPEWHGRGVGGRLLRHAIRQRKRVVLTVYVDNRYACDFYTHHGFFIIGEQLDEATRHMEYVMEYRTKDDQ